ncbi:MAG TPA: phenylalanine--tRNA ligase subunit beta [Fimbriimonadaceae bacterium]|nr:phenylalanine--tRNA ligase subunit beta [Fimbriimonadaceae bacterium]
MKFPYSMLRDFVETDLTAEQAGDLFTMAGFELEGIEAAGDDSVLDIKVVSNRGDGLSVFGLAREILAKEPSSKATELYRRACDGFANQSVRASIALDSSVAEIQSADCFRFACREFDGIQSAESPGWIQARLEAAGMRPISLLVDLTNYVMLELGQPLHAFDRDKLKEGRIVVRNARPGEKLTTLNGIEHDLSGQMMICDAKHPVGVPGVMGGLETEVTESTSRMLLESANFRNTTVRKTRKQLGLNTDASYRFERSVDPEGVVRAIERFTELLLQSQANVAVSNIVDHYPGKTTREAIRLRLNRANVLLGMEIPADRALHYLASLGFVVREGGTEWSMIPPSWRPDVVREEDLIEELGRVHGYEKIPELLPEGQTPVGGPTPELFRVDRLRSALVAAGFTQIISHSLRDSHPLDGPEPWVAPTNPASPEMSLLRNSLLPCLADAAVRNGGKDVHLFETGAVFAETGGRRKETKELGLLSCGNWQPAGWSASPAAAVDLFSVKGKLEDAFSLAGVEADFIAASTEDPRFHPGRFASIHIGREHAGVLAQIHPDVAENLGLPEETILVQLDLSALGALREPEYTPISRNPAVRRDISFEIAKSTPFSKIDQTIIQASGPTLEKHWLFDVYEGKGIAEGNHSLSLALQLRKPNSNFTDEEANQVRQQVVEALASLGAKAR